MNREAWLNEAVKQLRPIFKTHAGLDLPTDISVSVGWPSRGGTSTKRRVIGQCWQDSRQIFISPLLDDPFTVLSVLTHELVHAVNEPGTGHRGGFITVAKAVDLQRPWTATTAGESLTVWLLRILDDLPKYPHEAIELGAPKLAPQKTYMLKLTAPECGCTVRTTLKYIEIEGDFKCPHGQVLAKEEVNEA